MISRLSPSTINTASGSQQSPRSQASNLQLINCPSLDASTPFSQNELLARSILALEKMPSSFKKAKAALDLMTSLSRSTLEPAITPQDAAVFETHKEVLESYLMNALILPLCLKGFIHISQFAAYHAYKNKVSHSFLNPQVQLINPSLDTLIQGSLANALNENTLPFQDYTYNDFINILLTHPVQPYSLDNLRFLDIHCSHLGYRPLLGYFISGILSTIKSIDPERFQQQSDVNLEQYLEFFIFFTRYLSDCLELYSDDPDASLLPDSLSQNPNCSAKDDLKNNLSQAIAYLYVFNEYLIRAIEMQLEAPTSDFSWLAPHMPDLIQGLQAQEKFAYLSENDIPSSPNILSVSAIQEKAQKHIQYFSTLTFNLA